MLLSRAFALLAASLCIVACSPTSNWVVARELHEQLADEFHECVPLGWNPVRLDDGSLFPSYNSEITESDWYLPPPWLAQAPRNLKTPDARVARVMLEKLAAAGMVSKETTRDGARYHITMAAFAYLDIRNQRGDNRMERPFLCYSKLVPHRIVWTQPIHYERDGHGPNRVAVFRTAFDWAPSPTAACAKDDFIQSHSVILGPTESPAIAKFVLRNKTWYIESLSGSAAGHIVNPRVWPSCRTGSNC